MLGNELSGPSKRARKFGQLLGLHEPEMTARQNEQRILRQPAQNAGGKARFAGLDQQGGVIGTAHPSQQQPHDLDLVAPAQEALNERGDRGAELGAVDHEDDRQAEQCGKVTGRAGAVGSPVGEPHHAFADEQIGARACALEQTHKRRKAHRPAVEVEGGLARHGAVKEGVDEIRADLEGGHRQTALLERAQDTEHGHGLAGAGEGCGEEEGGRTHRPSAARGGRGDRVVEAGRAL